MHVIYNCSNAADKLTLYQNAFALRILSNSLLNPLSLADLMFLLDWKWGGFYSYQFKLAPLLKASIELNQTALDSFEHVLSSQINKYIFKGEKTDIFFLYPKTLSRLQNSNVENVSFIPTNNFSRFLHGASSELHNKR